jgi:hypothetical protein
VGRFNTKHLGKTPASRSSGVVGSHKLIPKHPTVDPGVDEVVADKWLHARTFASHKGSIASEP